MKTSKMKVEIWSDIMCPFCYIGKRHFEAALKQFPDAENIEIEWRSFQLDPSLPEKTDTSKSVYQFLADRKGISYQQSVSMHENVVQRAKQAGLIYNFDKALISNSFKAHRIIQAAKEKGFGDKAEERFFLAYFTEGKDLGDPSVLIALATEIGLTEADATLALTDERYAVKVNQDVQEGEGLGIRGVPFFVFNRKYGVSGAQPAEAFTDVLKKSFPEWKAENPGKLVNVKEGDSCTPGEDCK